MLVLMQSAGESVIISLPDGRTVKVLLVAIERGRARVGYTADRDIGVDREEIYERKLKERGNG
jgi:carbon storage regulator